MHKIFIDGQAGTTGLQIHGLLDKREDLEILQIADADRKNDQVKLRLLEESDVVILCLPDDAAVATVALAGNLPVKILDASTAHRISPDWTYGLPELTEQQRERIKHAVKVSNPGCYPTGFLLAVAPLVTAGLLPTSSALTINAISGYSGGGRQLIEKYQHQAASAGGSSWAIRPYALNLSHKHLPEMKHHAGLDQLPAFTPAVGNYRQGMLVQVPLFSNSFPDDRQAEQIIEIWQERYDKEPCVCIHPLNAFDALENGYLDPEALNGTNTIDLFAFSSQEHCVLIARLDNLGKGAAGAAVQNLNLMLGCGELTGLTL